MRGDLNKYMNNHYITNKYEKNPKDRPSADFGM